MQLADSMPVNTPRLGAFLGVKAFNLGARIFAILICRPSATKMGPQFGACGVKPPPSVYQQPAMTLLADPSSAFGPLREALAALLPTVLQRQGDLLAVKDAASGRYLHVNDAMAVLLGRPAAEVLGRTDADFFDAHLTAVLRIAEQSALAQTAALNSEHRFEWGGAKRDFVVLRLAGPVAAAGSRWLASVWSDRSAERQRETQLRQALEQIEQQQRANELLRRELSDQALRDPASGLYTRAHFEDQLKREADLSSREHREFAIVFIELDPVNDKVRALGEAGLRRIHEAMGRLLRGGTRAMDASCRFSESRFAVLLSGVGLATAHARMEGLRRQCATQIVVHDGEDLRFSVAMGVASFPHTAHTHVDLVAACEAALGEAKRRGGNHVTLAAIRFDAS
jgi:diguanylate cyclase (GGDEF)-like protein